MELGDLRIRCQHRSVRIGESLECYSMNLSEQFVRIAFLTIALHVIGLYVARTAYSDRVRYRRSIGLWPLYL